MLIQDIFPNKYARYRAKHPERMAASAARWREANRERERLRAIKYRQEHPERYLASVRKWRDGNKESAYAKRLAWGRANKEWLRERSQRRAATKRGGVVIDRIDVVVLAGRDRNRCGICGAVVPRGEWSVDHIQPLSRGGEHSYRNTRLTHLRCNISRGARGSAQLRLLG